MENLRRLKKTPPIEIRPITILVGRNSAGKSTYLRSMPLIRQSIETRSSAPILWWGDYVDFGDFSTAVSESSNGAENEAVFSFFVRDLSVHHRERYPYHRTYYSQRTTVDVDELSVSFSVSAHAGKTFLNRIQLEVPSEDIRFVAALSQKNPSENSLRVNGVEFSDLIRGYEIDRINPRLFTHPIFIEKTKESATSVKRYLHHNLVFAGAMERLLQANTPNNLSGTTIEREVRRVLSAGSLKPEALRGFERATSTKTFKRLYEKIREQPDLKVSKNIRNV